MRPAFIHVPRTGGNSILRCLEDRGVVLVHHVGKIDLSVLNGHWVFAFMRDPFDRLLSAYAYLNNGGLTLEDAKDACRYVWSYPSFGEFVLNGLRQAATEQRHFRPQCYWLTDDRGQVMANFIGRTEDLQAGFDFVCEQLGWEKTPVDILNQSNRDGLEVSEDLRAIIQEIYAEDFQMMEGLPEHQVIDNP